MNERVTGIVKRADQLQSLAADELKRRSLQLSWRAVSGCALQHLADEAFALVREACRRVVRITPFPVQLMGALALSRGQIAEMQTGEGKTLTAILPAYLYGLCRRGCHIVTTNDYLAQRDADFARPVFELLGLTTGCITTNLDDEQRKAAYDCDVTYGTAKEIGFDFLRDRLKSGVLSDDGTQERWSTQKTERNDCVQRGHFFALIDEADSILIDEAVTPLIIGAKQPKSLSKTSLYFWCQDAVQWLELAQDYHPEPEHKSVHLTEAGAKRVLLMDKPRWLDSFSHEAILRQVETAISASIWYKRDRDYVLKEDAVTIVDESTGRAMEGRQWRRGLHQAIEVKEGVPLTEATEQAAQVTIQTYFRRYHHLAGMTGTATPARRELRHVYNLPVNSIPTHRPCLRSGLPARVFRSDQDRNTAVVSEVQTLLRGGRSILIGTPSVSSSDQLAHAFRAAGIPHRVLNARFDAEEAEIVSEAGQPGRVTIATNMAGRGTDIVPHEDVRKHGGLHVIATAVHSAARIDRQLIGRTARQGDPGTYQFMLSLEDELLHVLGPVKLQRIKSMIDNTDGSEVSRRCLKWFHQAQKLLERQAYRRRCDLLKSEKRRQETLTRMGLDPFLEVAET